MPGEIIEELWRIKRRIAREQSNDVRQLVAHLENADHGDASASPRRSLAGRAPSE